MLRKHAITLLIVVFITLPSLIAIPASAMNEIEVSKKPKEDSWTSMSPMPTARFYLKVAVVEDKIYALGGYNKELKALTVNEMYDPETNTWTTKAPIPTCRADFAIAVYDNKIYCLGGKIRGAVYNGINGWQYFRVNEVYDPATDTWENKAPLPTARSEINAVVADGSIYVIGGSPNASLNEAYNPDTDAWSTKAPIQYYKDPNSTTPFIVTSSNSHAGYAVVVTIDENIFWITKTKNETKLLLQYNPTNDTWSSKTPPSGVFFPLAAIATTGIYSPKQIYITGANREVYDLATDRWSSGGQIPGIEGSGFAVLDDKIYCLGGRYSTWRVVAPSFAVPTGDVVTADNREYIPLGYGTIPPAVSVLAPKNEMSASDNLAVDFSVDIPVNQVTYSIDGQTNVTVSGNFTLGGLTWGTHSLIVYATDSFGNVGKSETIYFTVETPLEPILLGIAVIAVTSGSVILMINKKYKPQLLCKN